MLHLELQAETEARITADARRRVLSVAQLVEKMASAYALDQEALTAGLDDIAAGRTRPAREVFAELRAKHGIPITIDGRPEFVIQEAFAYQRPQSRRPKRWLTPVEAV